MRNVIDRVILTVHAVAIAASLVGDVLFSRRG